MGGDEETTPDEDGDEETTDEGGDVETADEGGDEETTDEGGDEEMAPDEDEETIDLTSWVLEKISEEDLRSYLKFKGLK